MILFAREVLFGVDSREVFVGGLGWRKGMAAMQASQQASKDRLIRR
jgi:hypothetical protein